MPSYQVDFTEWEGGLWGPDITLNILQTSKVIYEEAQAVLYKHSTIVVSYKEYLKAGQPPEPPIELSETGFKRVEIRMDHCMDPEERAEVLQTESLPCFCKMFMDQLVGVNTSQKELMTVTMRLDPENRDHQFLDRFLERWHDQPVIPSLGTLTDYRSVIIEWHESCGCATLHKPSKKCTRKPCAHVAKRIEVPISPLWNELEKTLGPKTTEQIILWDKGKWLHYTRRFMRHRNCHVRRWIYRPRAFANGRGVDDSPIPDRVRYGAADCNHSFQRLHTYRRAD